MIIDFSLCTALMTSDDRIDRRGRQGVCFRRDYLPDFVLMIFLMISFGCQPSVPLLINSIEQISPGVARQTETPNHFCNEESAYRPDTNHLDHTPIRYLRVNFHFMNSQDSSQNYQEVRARKFARQLMEEANKALEANQKMWLPPGNDTPVLPVRYRYQITPSEGFELDSGIYCHYDDRLFWFVSRGKNRNNYNRDVIQQYGIGSDSIINFFAMPHHPDSVKSPTYKVTSAGIALGSAVKLSGMFETRKAPWEFKGLINHEIGHVLGLQHSWNTNDGCDDTPRNPNCWNNDLPAPCDTAASNNLMDYNANQHAWSPCQIGKIHLAMSKEGSLARKMLIPTWCTFDSTKAIVIRDSVRWLGAKDLEGNLIIAGGGVLEVFCRLSIPPGGQIIVEDGGKLILHNARIHNACGLDWKGIQVYVSKKAPGEVLYYGDSSIENVEADPREMIRS